jgi:UDP-N-acetylmuramate dehydrogenase
VSMKVRKNQKMSDYTTIGIGGPVPEVYLPANEQELSDLLKQFTTDRVHYRIVGNGSNLLVDDRGLPEIIVCTRSMERIFQIDGEKVVVDAGYPAAQLAYQTASKGLAGLEFAVGIPGTIGGLVRMNAGAHKHTVSEVVDSVRLVKPNGTVLHVGNKELEFTYRSSAIPKDAIITAVVLKLTAGDSKQIHEVIRRYNDQRTSTQPLKEKSAGCIFKNPGHNAAGKLIEESGLKGFAIGGAVVSEMHANFIVNRKNASFEDVIALIDHIKHTVHEKQHVDLHEEVMIWRR